MDGRRYQNMDARERLGTKLLYKAHVSHSYWMANDFEKGVLRPPMFDKNQALSIIEMYDNIREKDDNKKGFSGGL